MKKQDASIKYLGPTSDYRSNRWRVSCECGRSFDPSSTMYARQNIECPRCGKMYFVDYNAEPKATIEAIK